MVKMLEDLNKDLEKLLEDMEKLSGVLLFLQKIYVLLVMKMVLTWQGKFGCPGEDITPNYNANLGPFESAWRIYCRC